MNILIAGDFAPRARLTQQIEKRNFGDVFSENLRKIIKSADFSFVNFESPIVEDSFRPITKCGPNLCCKAEAAEAVKYSGFSCVTMANNHILDYGVKGLRKTVECCESQGLGVVGVGNNLKEAEKVLYLSKDNKMLAVINCCEHEFSIATDKEAGANPLNPIRQFYLIKEAKKQADYVLVIVHGGHEHYQLPSPRMQETYRFFIDAGADAVVNHHQHCYSGYEIYKEKPIFYGLGNFCFDEEGMRNCSWNEGYMVMIVFTADGIAYELHPYTQCDKEAKVTLIMDNAAFLKEIDKLNSIIRNHTLLKKECDKYYMTTTNFYNTMLQPYENRVLNKLFRMGLLPSVISKRKKTWMLNNINCESHHDRFVFALKQIISKK